jgi:EAL domain-containing protein (putative c-di-GMP-specific phosphodiesterase class I)
MGDALLRRTEIELALRKPGIEEDIELAFQPIFDLETMDIVAFEALARWSHSTLGPVSPSDFIPITEQLQLVESLSESLLSRAIGSAKSWPAAQRLSFNLSPVQLCSQGSAERLLAILADASFPPTRLQIEVTEMAMMADLDSARLNIDAFRLAGVHVVLDDFGAGFASIGYLRELRFDGLKLDGSLLTACSSPYGGALLKGVVDLAASIGTPCIAEHVETLQDATMLRSIGCRFGQGYWLGRPVRADEAKVLANARMLPDVRLRLAS